ncbi:YihY/virulence factor BrkB family protein [Nesterenkonia alba]|uniref:YihY/virulence factor BrkB family protein n=1 Tax=Nesterenkonia alba TaxID=515814 RepID=UPI0003B6D303|nr:YihY/virulence factor BrkB family protein [Nesterenkonia alba]
MGFSSRLRPHREKPDDASTTGNILATAYAKVSKLDEHREATPATNPLDIEALKREELAARLAYGRARREGSSALKRATTLLGWGFARFSRTRFMRSVNLFFFHYGTVMAAGAAYMMFFSVAAILFAGFSVAGIVIGENREYQEFIERAVNNALPGVLGPGGLVEDPWEVFDAETLNTTLIVTLGIALVTSLSWVHGLRSGIRSIWERPLMAEFVVLVKIRDFGVLIVLGAVALTSAALGVISHGFIDEIFDVLGWDADGLAHRLTRLASLAIAFGLDMIVAVLLMRVASRLVMPISALWQSALIAGVGASLLRLASAEVLHSIADSPNPVIYTFGSVLALFFYFYLFGLVYLVAASWGAVAAADHQHR